MAAPFVLVGATNGEVFRSYVEQSPAPALERCDIVIGGIVIMDNVSTQYTQGTSASALHTHVDLTPASGATSGYGQQRYRCYSPVRRMAPTGFFWLEPLWMDFMS